MQEMLKKIAEKFPLTELPIEEKFAKMRVHGLKFTLSAYQAEGLGRVSVMQARGFFGLMKMETLLLTPSQVDAPVYSHDRVFAFGNDILIDKIYDTTGAGYEHAPLARAKSSVIGLTEEKPDEEHWYDYLRAEESVSVKGRKKDEAALSLLAQNMLEGFLAVAITAPPCAAEEKNKRNACYVHGLLANGGPSTDVFLKKFGREKTEELFCTYLFGV